MADSADELRDDGGAVGVSADSWNGSAGWSAYFSGDEHDDAGEGNTTAGCRRIVQVLLKYFLTAGAAHLERAGAAGRSLPLDYPSFVDGCPQRGIAKAIEVSPEKSLCCIALAAARAAEQLRLRHVLPRGCVCAEHRLWPRLLNYTPTQRLKSLNSATVGMFIGVRGNAIRVGSVRQQVKAMWFTCVKCGRRFARECAMFRYSPPTECADAPRCRGRSFQPDTRTAQTVDWQRIRVQELTRDDTRELGRIPRTVDVELVGDVIDSCSPGDVVTVCGVVKAMLASEGNARGGGGGGGGGGGRAKTQSLFHVYIDANCVQSSRRVERAAAAGAAGGGAKTHAAECTDVEHALFREIANDAQSFPLLVHSLCPQIYGHEMVKVGLLLSLLGGAQQGGGGAAAAASAAAAPRSHAASAALNVRPDVHCLIVGDPGLGKSQLLKAAANVASRGVYVCGNTSTTAGLTVTVVKEADSNDFSLDAGALVLGDQGVCCIDEFDKMGAEHQALLEAMEQQSVSIAKAGMLCNLSARTSVIAAANPRGGQYDRSKTVCENLKMSLPLLSRFDLVFILLDRRDAKRDKFISDHVMATFAAKRANDEPGGGGGGGGGGAKRRRTCSWGAGGDVKTRPDGGNDGAKLSHDGDGEDGGEDAPRETQRGGHDSLLHRLQRYRLKDPIPVDMLRRYIAYARLHVHPILSEGAKGVLQRFYLALRRGVHEQSLDTTPVTTRQLESLIRLSQARAKAQHRQIVTECDALDVIELSRASMMDTFADETGRIDFGRASGMSRSKEVQRFMLALHADAERADRDLFTVHELRRVARNINLRVPSFDDFLDAINQQNLLLKRARATYQLQGTTYHTQS